MCLPMFMQDKTEGNIARRKIYWIFIILSCLQSGTRICEWQKLVQPLSLGTDDPVVKPLNVYGQTKYEGELAVEKYTDKYYIVRIAWVFGVNGKNFIKTMLNLGKTHDTLTVVDDQIGTPTYTYDLAKLLVDMLEKEEYGKYHVTNEGGYISWCDFAKEIFRQAGMNVTVTPVSSDQYPAKAKRPSNSRLEKKKLTEHGFTRLPDWQDALARYLKEIM